MKEIVLNNLSRPDPSSCKALTELPLKKKKFQLWTAASASAWEFPTSSYWPALQTLDLLSQSHVHIYIYVFLVESWLIQLLIINNTPQLVLQKNWKGNNFRKMKWMFRHSCLSAVILLNLSYWLSSIRQKRGSASYEWRKKIQEDF